MRKRLIYAAVVLLLATVAGACGYASSAINEACLVYSGGTWEDSKFSHVMKPGSNSESIVWGSKKYCYRTDQRTFIAGEGKQSDVQPVEVVSKDGVRMAVEYQLYFKVNQAEETLVRFHENLGVKTDAWTEEGWKALLNQYFGPQVERALEVAGLKHDARPLRENEEARRKFEVDTVTALKGFIKTVIGDEYFCGPAYDPPQNKKCGDFTFTVGKPDILNGKIVAAIEERIAADTQVDAAASQQAAAEAQAAADQALVDLYGPDGALILKMLASGQIDFWPIPTGSPIVVPQPGG